MIDSIFVRACVLVRLRQNPLQPHLEELATTLYEQGYARRSIQDSVRAGDKFGWWGWDVQIVQKVPLRNFSYINNLKL